MLKTDITGHHRSLFAQQLRVRQMPKTRFATRPAVLEIGSNGARLMYPNGESYRFAIRLASHVFDPKKEKRRYPISKEGQSQLHTVIALALQRCKAHNVTHLCCVATSALREAPNRAVIQKAIAAKTGINIQCITGKLEAQLIAHAISALAPKHQAFFAVDIGGGSIEVIACKDSVISFKVSAALGSVTLKDLKSEEVLQRIRERMILPLRQQIKTFIKSGGKPAVAYVTGGNPQDLIRMATHRRSETISVLALRRYARRMLKFSKSELKSAGLKVDRVDVIKNATLALMAILEALDVTKVTAPDAGLRSGVYRKVFGELPHGEKFQSVSRLSAEIKVLQENYALVDTHCKLVERSMIRQLGLKTIRQKLPSFRPAALVTAAAALHDIGHSLVTKGKHAERGAELLQKFGISSLSKTENLLLCWLVENHNNFKASRAPALAGLGKKEERVAIRLLQALRQAERTQHEHVL